MNHLILLMIVVIAMGLGHTAVFGQEKPAEKKKQSAASSEIRMDTREPANTTGPYLLQKKEQYQKKAEEKLHRFEEKLKRLYIRAEKKGMKAKEKLSGAADDLRKKSESAKNKLNDIKESGEEKWEKARGELDVILKDLERSYKRTAATFND